MIVGGGSRQLLHCSSTRCGDNNNNNNLHGSRVTAVVFVVLLLTISFVQGGGGGFVVSFITPTTTTTTCRGQRVRHYDAGDAWSSSSSSLRWNRLPTPVQKNPFESRATTTTTLPNEDTMYRRLPLLNFRDSNETINDIDRLDDAIMGGISTSVVRQQQQQQQQPYAIWSGICRTDGGGFCGFRTNPFQAPYVVPFLQHGSTDHRTTDDDDDTGGFYIKCRLVSDNEPERRVWKLTTRTKPDRGELLYQAPFEIAKRGSIRSSNGTSRSSSIFDDVMSVEQEMIEWQTIHVPFDRFRLVRGPQVVQNGPPLNVSAGIYQLGMTMSQFVFATADTPNQNNNTANTRTEKTLPNFRDGYFELHIEEMGVYSATSNSKSSLAVQPESRPLRVLSKDETKEKRSVLLKALFVVAKLFFSEQSQRRKSTLRILRNKYNMTRFQAIRWGFQRRLVQSESSHVSLFRKLQRIMSSTMETVSILSIDTIRSILSLSIKLFLFYPLRLVTTTLGLFKPNKKKMTTTP